MANQASDIAATRALVERFIGYMKDGRFDSLATLTSTDCSLMENGRRYSVPEYVNVLASIGFHNLQMLLDSVIVRTDGNLGYLKYDADATYEYRGGKGAIHESALVQLRRTTDHWQIVAWANSQRPLTDAQR